MSGDVTTQDLTQGGPAVLVALINQENLIYLPEPLTVPKATFSDPSSFGGDGANTVITVGTTDPATYGAGTVAVHYTRADLATLPATQPALTGNPPTVTPGTASTTGTGLADAFSGAGVTLAANDLVVITGQGGFAMAAGTFATGDDFALAISTIANIEGFATWNSSTNQLDFSNTSAHEVTFSTAFGSQAADLGFPATVAGSVTTVNYTVADVLSAINTAYGLNLTQATVTQTVTAPLTLNEDGSYTQQITAVSNDMLYTGQKIFTFVVPAPVPVAAFTSSANYLAATFTDASTDANGTIASWAWTFGDGTTSTSQNPTHTYAANGTYSVTLTVTDADGETTSFVSHPITVAAIVPTVAAAFTFETAGYTATFTDASTDVNGTLATWDWNFGDGNTASTQNPTHVYTTTGSRAVTLTVTDANGVTTATVSHQVTISAPVVVAGFTNEVTHLSVAFTDTSTDTNGEIAAWDWNFGDGTTSTEQNPTHLYPDTGSYSARLIVTDADGVTTDSHTVVVSPVAPPIVAGYTFAYDATNLDLIFTDTSTDTGSSIGAYLWDFGDGNSSTEASPTHSYAESGNYAVKLTVTDANGVTTSSVTNTVPASNETLAADFTFVVTGGSVAFTDATTSTGGQTLTWDWYFADSGTSTVQNPTHVYAQSNTYSVQLTVTDEYGFTSVAAKSVTVALPQVTAHFTTVANAQEVTFTDTSTDTNGTLGTWEWHFGDGQTSTEQNPVHTYALPGQYLIKLIATDVDGVHSDDTQAPQIVGTTPITLNPQISNPGGVLDIPFDDDSTSSAGDITAWHWDFGDGTTSTEKAGTHTYAVAGYYDVTLTVTDSVGNSAVAGLAGLPVAVSSDGGQVN